MSDVKWTRDQQSAIDIRDCSVLVSAAAGSGKTAVLVERLISRIRAERLDVTQFLIITYTKAAASELRRKIGDALSVLMLENPDDRHLRRQLALVDNARISTVHSFCMWVLKNYGNNPSLSAGFRILDEAEGAIILSDTLRELIEDKYDEGDEDFLALSEYMSDSRSDGRLFSAVAELYHKSRSHPYPEKWLCEVAGSYDTEGVSDVCDTLWGKEAFETARRTVGDLILQIHILLEDVDTIAQISAKYHDHLTELEHSLKGLLCDTWDEMAEALSDFEVKKLPSSAGISDKRMPERISYFQKKIKADVAELRERLVPMDSEPLLEETAMLAPVMHTLAKLASELDEAFRKEKLRRGLLDYSDLEHFAIELLIDDYDAVNDVVTPSSTGLEVSESFCEILLDEFQDSNIIQDIIFRSVSKNEKNIVMVGDVKQSIYGFRLADPSIFMKKYRSFTPVERAEKGEATCITLAQNFRSRREVLDASNSIFSAIMSEELGGVDYDENQRLVPRDEIPFSGREDMKCEFCLIDVDNADENKSAEAEAKFVAAKIAELVRDGFEICDKSGGVRKVRYGDFAILLRAVGTTAQYYEKAFGSFGIPFVSPKATGLLGKSEVSAVIAYLSVIDNPTSDIQLLATLRSPMFGFSADELCHIRRSGKDSLIYAMEACAEREDSVGEKCRSFLDGLSELRSLARGMSAGELIWEVYNRTNALGVFGAMPFGDERQRNLIELYKSAEALEGLGYFGLYKFISHLARLAENGGDITAPAAHAEDAVTIMTMHKSKGLEFPVVFIGNAIRSFNLEDTKKDVLIHPKLGVGLRYRDEKLGADYSTVIRDIIRNRIISEMKSEEMRLLYVAMTRAREKLYIVASQKNASSKIAKIQTENAYKELDAISLRERNDAQLWYMLPLLRSVTGSPILEYAGCDTFGCDGEVEGMQAYVKLASEIELPGEKETEPEKENEESELAEISKMIEFCYEYEEATKAPSKVTATGLGRESSGSLAPRRKRMQRPRFMRDKSLTAAERGTALHMAMQFADFERCKTPEGAKAELLRLREEKYLTQKQFEACDAEKLFGFVSSELGCVMLGAKNVCREFKFSVLLPSDELPGLGVNGEKVLLQGVMDMYFETDDGVTIVDFKTDRHRPEGDVLEKYATQLRIYRRALYEMTGKEAKHLVLYLASLGECIEII
ncbi:MAG: helicase-exonuclease AddAB subunit AddA [Oscillospiraceae bacterium]|nr:helicase-exonuclease AddAB subunit AddA [Oscillospiraceae bacterium]